MGFQQGTKGIYERRKAKVEVEATMTMTAALTTSKLCARQWVQVQGHRTTGGKASRPGQAPTHSGRRLARRNVTQMKAFESDKKGSSSSSSFSRSLAVAGLSAMLLLQAQTADAKVVLKQSEARKVFQPAPVEKKAPKGPRKPKEKKAGGGFTAPKFNAPTLSAPSISLSGPLGTLAFVLGSVGLFVGAALSYAKVDDGWWEFINEAMA